MGFGVSGSSASLVPSECSNPTKYPRSFRCGAQFAEGGGDLKKAANLIASALVSPIVVTIHDIDQSDPYEIKVA